MGKEKKKAGREWEPAAVGRYCRYNLGHSAARVTAARWHLRGQRVPALWRSQTRIWDGHRGLPSLRSSPASSMPSFSSGSVPKNSPVYNFPSLSTALERVIVSLQIMSIWFPNRVTVSSSLLTLGKLTSSSSLTSNTVLDIIDHAILLSHLE